MRKLATCPNMAGHVRRLTVQGGRLDYFRSYDEWKSEVERRLADAEVVGFSEGLDPFNGFQEQELEAGWKSYEKLIEHYIVYDRVECLLCERNTRRIATTHPIQAHGSVSSHISSCSRPFFVPL